MAQPDGTSEPKQNSPYRKILVTGGLGFVGANVCRQLLNRNPELDLVVLDRFSYAADHRRLDGLDKEKRFVLVRGDVRNDQDVEQALEGCDAVVHLAAETHVARSFSDPGFFFDANANGTENLLRLVRQRDIKHFVHVSSAAVYGSVVEEVDEDAPLRATSPYGMSKALAEEAVMLAARKGLRCSILRPANVVGVGQNPEKLFPRFFMQAMKQQPLTIEGTGFQERSFLPVSDLANAIDLVLMRQTTEKLSVFNVPGQDRLTVLEAASKVFELTQPMGRVAYVEDRARNDLFQRIDGSRIRALGFTQRRTLRQELEAIHADLLSRVWLQSGRS
ncbi:MAG: NAD-dependent epimerase/dehydratase family protein [Roseibium sp.]|uniref:NAD-dependent epimerase/dehydratase family protein n=1 Tax=Roseibium sp. TaxID=1936156 RepID=UPI001B21E507|nr:NAD-dependent epimerase/dehydratase family protein [Roseibium sp.]MBO6894211.1 NAD-dependent epimerase/dehydratase family protein [Roseibium sp.]MBO6928877.1 NAD-dependent epimerase/dehydratase family protein [Roseibium sp.]